VGDWQPWLRLRGGEPRRTSAWIFMTPGSSLFRNVGATAAALLDRFSVVAVSGRAAEFTTVWPGSQGGAPPTEENGTIVGFPEVAGVSQ